MSETPSEMKKLVEEWSKKWGYTVKDTTTQQGNAPIEWILEISNKINTVIVFTLKDNPDALHFQTKINLSPEHRQKTVNFSNEEYNTFVLDITDRLAVLGCDWVFEHDSQNQKQMNALIMSYFVIYDNADKNTVLQIISKAFINISQMVRALSITLNKGGDPKATSIDSSFKNTSIYG